METHRKQTHCDELAIPGRGQRCGLDLGLGLGLPVVCDVGETEVGWFGERERRLRFSVKCNVGPRWMFDAPKEGKTIHQNSHRSQKTAPRAGKYRRHEYAPLRKTQCRVALHRCCSHLSRRRTLDVGVTARRDKHHIPRLLRDTAHSTDSHA